MLPREDNINENLQLNNSKLDDNSFSIPFHKKLAFKLVLGSSCAVFIGVGIFLIIFSRVVITNEIELEKVRLLDETRLVTELSNEKIDIITKDIFALTNTPPITGIIRARDNDGFDIEGASTYDQWRSRLETIFTGLILSKDFYAQLRYIDRDGDEIVRVNNVGGLPHIVGDSELQNKSDRYYFTETIVLPEGSFYLSDIDLNREGNPPVIETPYVPVIRYAIPIYHEGNAWGVVVSNIYAEQIIEQLDLKTIGDSMVVDQNGYYLHHKNKHKLWGNPRDLDTGENLLVDYPIVGYKIISAELDVFETDDELIAHAPIDTGGNSNKDIIFIRTRDKSQILAPVYDLLQVISLIAGVIVLVVSVMIYMLVGIITQPIGKLTAALKKVAEGDFDQHVEVQGNNETSILTRRFNNMISKLKNSYENLEKKVDDRTKELTKKIAEIESINDILVKRELKMIELKRKIKKLSQREHD